MTIHFKPGRIYRAPKPTVLRLRRFWMAAAAPPPASFDVNAAALALTGLTVAPQMDENDQYSCCVMASQAKFLRRAHALQVGTLINISAAQILAAYQAQTGGQDIGLVPDDSLAIWQSPGWAAGDDGALHTILGSARIDATDPTDVQLGISKLGGGILGGGLIPRKWIGSKLWEPWNSSDPIAGGHEVWIGAYDANADTYACETWDGVTTIVGDAFRTVFAEANHGELSGIIRGIDSVTPIDGLDTAAIQAELQRDEEQ